mgnify:CR=1 FL=1
MTRSSRKGRRLQKKQSLLTKILNAIMKHLASLGFTNRLAIYILLFLAGGFYLALRSIITGYTGALMCWTVVFTPIGTACSIVLSKIVHKSEVENSSADGEGIKYATAKANNFGAAEDINSPAI